MVRDYNSNSTNLDSEDEDDPRTPTSVSSQVRESFFQLLKWPCDGHLKFLTIWHCCLRCKTQDAMLEPELGTFGIFPFFYNKKWFFCFFYKVHNLFLHQSYFKKPTPSQIYFIKNAKNQFLLLIKLQKIPQVPSSGSTWNISRGARGTVRPTRTLWTLRVLLRYPTARFPSSTCR